MKKPLKIGLFSLGTIVLLLIALTAALPWFLKLDAVRTLTEEKATAALGRQVSIGGTGFSLWTGPKVRLENLTIAESGGFGDEPFARLGSFDLSVRFWPIFGGRIEIDHIIVNNPEVRVLRNSSGMWNYDDITARFAKTGEEKKAVQPSPAEKGASTIPISFLARDIRIVGEIGRAH
ncbi:MAG TPA: AsmA family protein, partial [Proteobacteria bacterium]|nr:AsmA family protein [Pseudomonadota bacterium]